MDSMLRSALRKNIGLRHQLERNLLGDNGEVWDKELKKFLRQEPCWTSLQEEKVEAPQLLKLVVSDVNIHAAPAVKTTDCFKIGDGVFVYRDSDFNNWLPKTVPVVGGGAASMFELQKELNFQEMIQAHLGITGSLDEIKRALIKKEKCWSPRQIDELIRQCESGENPLKLRADGYANLFFLQVGKDVFAVYANRNSGGWGVYVNEFAYANRWGVAYRVSFRNC